jgi:protease I
MQSLHDRKIAIIALDGFEEAELVQPRNALEAAGALTHVISEKPGEIQGYKHHEKSGKVTVDRTLNQVKPDDYDGLLLPGGALNADHARANPQIRHFIQEFDRAGKPMAVICHAPWELISAGVVGGRKLTGWHTIADDVRNAGGEWRDQEVVVDQNLVTSRGPDDIPAFNREMLALLARVTVETHR